MIVEVSKGVNIQAPLLDASPDSRTNSQLSPVQLIDSQLSVPQITENLSLKVLDKDSLPAIPTERVAASRISDSEAYRTTIYSLIH